MLIWLPLLQGNTVESCSVLSVFLCKAAFQPFRLWPALLHGIILPLMQNLVFASLEFHGPIISTGYVPLSSDHTLFHENCSPWFGSLARSELSLITLIVNNYNKLLSPSTSSCGMPLIRLSAGLVTVDCYCWSPTGFPPSHQLSP